MALLSGRAAGRPTQRVYPGAAPTRQHRFKSQERSELMQTHPDHTSRLLGPARRRWSGRSCPRIRRSRSTARRRGAALVFVLLATMVAMTLAGSFLSAQSTSVSLARNTFSFAQARFVAESGMAFAVGHVENSDTWRTEHASATWVTDQSFGPGTFTVTVVDGYDADGDGTITTPTEGDGDLADDETDLATIEVTAIVQGATHVARAVITPVAGETKRVLFVVPDQSNLSVHDELRKARMESWGYEVVPFTANQSANAYDAALADVDVVEVTEETHSSHVGTKLRDTEIGVVNEERALIDELQMANSGGSYSDDEIDIVENAHYITSGLSLGNLTILNSSEQLNTAGSSLAPGATVLAERVSSNSVVMAAIDAGEELRDGSLAHGRRVYMPWGADSFDAAELNEDGWLLLKRSLEWASAQAAPPDPILHYNFSSQAGTNIQDVIGELDAQIENGNGSITWIDDPLVGEGVYFNQNAQSGTAVIRTSSDSTADGLKSALQTSNAITIQAFVKAEGFDNSGGRIVSHSGSTSMDDRNFTLMGDNDGSNNVDLAARIKYSSSVSEYRENDCFTLNNYHVLAVTIDLNSSSDNVKLYVDGELVDTNSRSGSFANWTSEAFLLGNEDTRDRPYRGYLYDVKVWDRVLSATQLKDNADALLPGDSDTAQLIAAYTFQEVLPNATLIGHWKLDDTSSSAGPGVLMQDTIAWGGWQAVIDSYHASQGAYGGGLGGSPNAGSEAVVAVNSTGNNRITMWSNTEIRGDVYIGPDGDLDQAIKTWDSSTITGTRDTLAETITIPQLGAPSGSPFDGSHEGSIDMWGSMSETITTDRYFNSVSLWDQSKLVIDGNVTLLLNGSLNLGNNAEIELLPGASLDLYIKGTVGCNGSLNTSTEDPSKMRIYMIGNNRTFSMWNVAQVYALLHSNNGAIAIWDGLEFFGRMRGRKLDGNGKIHIDLDSSFGDGGGIGGGPPNAVEEISANDGTCTGGPTGGEDGFGDGGTAFGFDGNDDYVLIPHAAAYMLDAGAVSFWFRPDDVSGHQGLFSKDSTGYDNGGHIHVYLDGSTLRTRLQSTTASYTVSSGGLSAGTWYHAVVVFGPNGLRLYLNGTLADDDDYTGGLGTSSGGSGNSEPIVLGANTWGSGDQTHLPLSDYYHGRIDDVRIYDDELDSHQVQALYNNQDIGDPSGPGYLVQDVSGFGTPLNLYIDDPDEVTWLDGGGLQIDGNTRIISPGAATKLYDALTATNEFTIEVIFAPENLTQSGPSRIVSYSTDTSYRNFTVHQSQLAYGVRLRTTDTGGNGTPDLNSGTVLTTASHHVIITCKDEQVKLYRNGNLEGTHARSGDFAWNNAYPLVMVNEVTDNRPWLGTLTRVAIYDRGMSSSQITEMFGGEAPSEEGTGTNGYTVRWEERK
jgi:hypothetical protein